MVHNKRTFNITKIFEITDLAYKLTNITWTLCTGFEFQGYLFLNDSFSENGAQEYAVIKISEMIQVESYTFSWMSKELAQIAIGEIISGKSDDVLKIEVDPDLDYSNGHSCQLCR
jgi:hypothetical protein